MAQNSKSFSYDFPALEQGTYFERGFTISSETATFLAGKEILMQVRDKADKKKGKLLLEFRLSANTIVLSGTTLVFKIGASFTDIPEGEYFYDVKAFTVADPDDNEEIMEGRLPIKVSTSDIS
jgi:hypothetical protein